MKLALGLRSARVKAGAACRMPEIPAGGPEQVFAGRSDQVRAVRAFVREALADHPAVGDAVLVASELATNAVRHTLSGLEGGSFIVRLAKVSATHAAVLVTDQGSSEAPLVRAASDDEESGRGLAVVKSVSCELLFLSGVSAVLAVVPAESPSNW